MELDMSSVTFTGYFLFSTQLIVYDLMMLIHVHVKQQPPGLPVTALVVRISTEIVKYLYI